MDETWDLSGQIGIFRQPELRLFPWFKCILPALGLREHIILNSSAIKGDDSPNPNRHRPGDLATGSVVIKFTQMVSSLSYMSIYISYANDFTMYIMYHIQWIDTPLQKTQPRWHCGTERIPSCFHPEGWEQDHQGMRDDVHFGSFRPFHPILMYPTW